MTSNQDSFVGRAEEWAKITHALDRVRLGASSVLIIHGEAGIGKTRMIQELIAHAERSGFAVLAGRAEDLERMRPFGAIADVLRNFGRTDLASTNPAEVVDRFVELVEELALAQPTCVVLEDLHWADPDTIAAARALTRRLAYLPILFVGTHRPHPQSPELQRFVDVGIGEAAVVVELRPLDDESVLEIGAGILGGTVGPRLANMLAAASGNALYAVELARALLEVGVLQRDGGTIDASITELPPTLRLTILRRLSQFPADVLEVLKAAAILGSAFHLHELAAIVEQPVATVARSLEGPIAAKILEERGARLAFRHDLIHEAIYEDIPAPIRASQHVDVAHRLRDLGVPPIRIAEHMIRGLDLGDPALFEEVIPLMVEIRLGAPLVGVALADKALELPGVDEQRRDDLRRYVMWPLVMTGRREDAIRLGNEALRRPLDPMTETAIRYVLSAILSEDGRSLEGAAEFEAVINDPRTPPTTSLLARIMLPAVRLRAGMFEGVPLFEQLLEEARATDDRLAITLATGAFAAGLVAQGRIAEAIREAEAYIEMEQPFRTMVPAPYGVPAVAYMAGDRLGDVRIMCQEARRRASEVGEVPANAYYGPLEGFACFLAGDWDDAIEETRLGLELVEQQIGSPVCFVIACTTLAQISLRRGNLEAARSHAGAAERMIAAKGPQWGMDVLAWTKALCLEASGDPSSALDAFLEGWDFSPSGHLFFARPAFPDLVRMAIAADDRARAKQVTEEAEAAGDRAPEVASVVGTALRCRGLLDDDLDALVAAVDAYRESPRVVEKAAAFEDAAGVLARRGKTPDARALFEEALAVFEELGAVHDAAHVSAAMRSAGIRRGSRAPRRRPATGWEALTPTEVEVARLTIEGLSNPKIGERLFVSQRTVQTHLSHIFGKLGISSRVDLARIAGERTRT